MTNHFSESTSASGKRTDIKKIAVIGAGPIVIGQACEFDYSGTQACKMLRREGYEVVLINSNPATIMTDPQVADRTYIESLTVEWVTKILEKERPDALLSTLGGQTALNLSMDLAQAGVLDRLGIELLGASVETIRMAENREAFRDAMIEIGLPVPKSVVVRTTEEATAAKSTITYPAIIRAAFTLGGTGGSIAYNAEEYDEMVQWGLANSPVSEVLVEESVLGWKEVELEVMRDRKDQVVIVCGIENVDPMGVHTGDSVTVAPIQTLTDKELQLLRDYAKAVMRKVGVNTGGSNVQFAVDPESGRVVVIEMNPRVSRSSALASKATGFPIAKIAALLAVGYSLDEIKNDITGKTYACFEPALDYVVVKIPRFNFEKFRHSKDELGPQMRSVGEVMAMGRTFQESFQKALRGLETKHSGFNEILRTKNNPALSKIEREEVEAKINRELNRATPKRLFWIAEAFRWGFSVERVALASRLDPWFLSQFEDIIHEENFLRSRGKAVLSETPVLHRFKKKGFSDARIAELAGVLETDVRTARWNAGLRPVYLVVDTCAGEFPSNTPYYYSTYHQSPSPSTVQGGVAIIGSGPNRIGQGIEFDYCCVQACEATRTSGRRTVMINCNPETVSTDYDTSDALYFEPLTVEDVTEVLEQEKISDVMTCFGGQTPLLLSGPLSKSGYRLLGANYDQIDLCEDRRQFQALIEKLKFLQPKSITAASVEDALKAARTLGFPILARPSYVIGGRGMVVISKEEDLQQLVEAADGVEISEKNPLLIDLFLKDAIEVDVDALRDRDGVVWIPGIMEHIEEAGVHSGDSTCSFPPYTLSEQQQSQIRKMVTSLIQELGVVGLVNVQLALRNREIYVIEVNPRASRTVPFLSKAIGKPLAAIATRIMLGETFASIGISVDQKSTVKTMEGTGFAIKMPVFPFLKFSNVDPVLGPEMRSTGEVMAVGKSFGAAFRKAMQNVFNDVPAGSGVFISMKDEDKPLMVEAALRLQQLGLKIYATAGTAAFLQSHGIVQLTVLKKVQEGRPHVLDAMKNNEINLVFNTTLGKRTVTDAQSIRRTALMRRIPYFTTVSGAYAAIEALICKEEDLILHCLQDAVRT